MTALRDFADHDHQMILVVEDMARGRMGSEAWTRETGPG